MCTWSESLVLELSRVMISSSDCSWMNCVTLNIRHSLGGADAKSHQSESSRTVTMETFVFAEEKRWRSDWSSVNEWVGGAQTGNSRGEERQRSDWSSVNEWGGGAQTGNSRGEERWRPDWSSVNEWGAELRPETPERRGGALIGPLWMSEGWSSDRKQQSFWS